MLQDQSAGDYLITGSAANLIPEPEPEKTPGPRRPGNENNEEPGEGEVEPMEINTPTREQETREEREISGEINTPSPHTAQAARPADNAEELRPLDGSTPTEAIRRRSGRVSIPTDRFKMPDAPRSKRGAKSSIAPSLKSLKAALKESWAQRPDSTAPLRRRSRSRESSGSTRTRAASLERVQTGSIKNSSSARSSVRSRYEVAGGNSFVQKAEDSSWSNTEDEADKSSQKVKEGINTISGQNSKIAKVKNSVTLHPGQGAWVYLVEEPGQVSGNDFIFPILFNTVIEKNIFASKFSPKQECCVHLQFT